MPICFPTAGSRDKADLLAAIAQVGFERLTDLAGKAVRLLFTGILKPDEKQ